MRSALQNLARNPGARNASLVLLEILIVLSATPAMASAESLSVKTDKDTYNIGDSVSISGTATPNASVSIKLRDPSNATKVESEAQVAFDGSYSMESIYILKAIDEPGMWRVNVCDLSSNETVEAIFEVVALWERLETLEGQLAALQNETQALEGTVEILETQLAHLQNQTQTLEGTVETLETSVEGLSSRLSAAETSSMIAYVAIGMSVVSVVLSIVAITRYLQKRDIYRRLVGKTERGRIRRR